mgnify:CR=1 FL=1
MARQLLAHSSNTLASAVVVRRVARYHRDFAMTERQQVLRHANRREPVRESHAVVVAIRIDGPGQLERNAGAREKLIKLRRVVHADQHQAVDAALDQGPRDFEFRLRVVIMAAQEQCEACFAKRALQRLRGMRENRIIERRNGDTDRARTPRRERARPVKVWRAHRRAGSPPAPPHPASRT